MSAISVSLTRCKVLRRPWWRALTSKDQKISGPWAQLSLLPPVYEPSLRLARSWKFVAPLPCLSVFHVVGLLRHIRSLFPLNSPLTHPFLSCVGVGVFKAMTLSFGNTVYLHLPLGYIQMLKAFSPVLMLFLLYITGVEKRPTIQVALSVLSIAAFTAITTTLETSATALGLFYMVWKPRSKECPIHRLKKHSSWRKLPRQGPWS